MGFNAKIKIIRHRYQVVDMKIVNKSEKLCVRGKYAFLYFIMDINSTCEYCHKHAHVQGKQIRRKCK